jgi:hypothetical protein
MDPMWPHLGVCYELLLRLVSWSSALSLGFHHLSPLSRLRRTKYRPQQRRRW